MVQIAAEERMQGVSMRTTVRPVPNAAPLMYRTKLNKVRLWSSFGATADCCITAKCNNNAKCNTNRKCNKN